MWILWLLVAFALGFILGKIRTIWRFSKWLESLGPSDQELVRTLLRNHPQPS